VYSVGLVLKSHIRLCLVDQESIHYILFGLNTLNLAILPSMYQDLYLNTSAKKNTLHSVSPCSTYAPDVPGAYNVNFSSGYVCLGSFRQEINQPAQPLLLHPLILPWLLQYPADVPPLLHFSAALSSALHILSRLHQQK